MKPSHVITAMIAVLGLLAGPASSADPRRDAILAELLAQAKKDEPGFTGFSAERGAAFYRATHQGGKPGTASCTSCHGTSPQDKGKTRAGKDIEPMAVSKNPARYTDKDNVEKWFTPQLPRCARAGLHRQGEGRLHHLHDGAVTLHEDGSRGHAYRDRHLAAGGRRRDRPSPEAVSASRRSPTRWSRRNAGAATWSFPPQFLPQAVVAEARRHAVRPLRGECEPRRGPAQGRARLSRSPMPRTGRRPAARDGSSPRASRRRRRRSASPRRRAG